MKAAAIIQARMTSTRLPGKILMKVLGRPLLSFQLERIRHGRMVDRIIIATTVNKTDDPVARLAMKEGVQLFRGSEGDVLDRYYQAAKQHGLQHIMRLTADCPLIDPDICDLVAARYFESGVDYVITSPSFAEGLDCEVFGFGALELAWKKAKENAEREHVTLYIRNHPGLFKIATLENRTDDSRYRITVDEETDFLVVKAVLENLYDEENPCFNFSEIKSFLDARPEISRLNAHIVRNEGLVKSLSKER